ncbi:MAG TPA: nucleotide exchange factor GrpE [Bacteroidales bacterium]|nr:nucleotide exchange factor GrpE [Bacteroidales bacterium]HPS17731.1 nucleotide exchange factor GrpE [Bacteroidales bacterium]
MNKKKGNKEEISEKENIEAIEEKPVSDNQAQENTEQLTEENNKEPEKKEATPEEKYAELNDRFLRLYSEFDNYRKRTLKERIDLIKTASEDIIKTLLPVIDDLERAITSMKDQPDNSSLEGINLIYLKFKNILTQKGIEDIKTLGESFNTDFHEAVTTIPSENDEQKGKVVDVVEKGYLLNGKVIRYAKVIVAE